jgi:hypothetical protein
MYVRCAYFEGDVDPADREKFGGATGSVLTCSAAAMLLFAFR